MVRRRPSQFSINMKPAHMILSFAILLLCLAITFYVRERRAIVGFSMNDELVVVDYIACASGDPACRFNNNKVQLQDQILAINDRSKEDFAADRRQVPFSEFEPGDIVHLDINRNGERIDVEWQMIQPEILNNTRSILVSFLIFGPFWLMGSLHLLYLEPEVANRRLQVIFYYVLTLWIVFGLQSVSRYLYSSLLVHALSWLLLPVFIHFHIEIPSMLWKNWQRIILPILYTFSIIMAILELWQLLPGSAYIIAIGLAFIAGLVILGYRTIQRKNTAEGVDSRIMLGGIIFGLGPGIFLWMLPAAFGSDPPGQVIAAITVLALPILPLFYSYGVHKRRIGILEGRINRALSRYSLFIIYLILLSIAVIIASREQTDFLSRNLLYLFFAIFAFLLVALPFNEWSRNLISRLAYGSYYNPEKVVNEFIDKILQANNRDELIGIIVDQLCPTLMINQSILITFDSGDVSIYYQNELDLESDLPSPDELLSMVDMGPVRIELGESVSKSLSDRYDWIRLIIPLEGKNDFAGLWMFGHRKPDNYYTDSDIELLDALARQLAISIENEILFGNLRKELDERKLAEQRTALFNKRLTLLRQLDRLMLQADQPEEIAQESLIKLAEMLSCTRATVTYITEDPIEVTYMAVYDKRPYYSRLELPEFKSKISEVSQLGRGNLWILKNANELDPESELGKHIRAQGITSALSVPLLIQGNFIGSLNVAYESSTIISDENVEIAQEIASSLAVAINNAQLRDKITRHSHDLKQLSARLIKAQETERKRLSYELHDEIGQLLTAIMFDLAAIEQLVEGGSSQKLLDHLSDAKQIIEELMIQVRTMSLELRPAMLQDLGLIPTLRWYVNGYAERRNLTIDFEVDQYADRYDEEVEIALYRICQEALTNISRHAQATRIRLSLNQEDHRLSASIEDNGVGFDVKKVQSHPPTELGAGLIAMRERAVSLGGTFQLITKEGKGTQINIEIPVGEGVE